MLSDKYKDYPFPLENVKKSLIFNSWIAHAQHELSWMMGKMCNNNNDNNNNNFIKLLKKAFQLNLQCEISKT